MSAERLRRRTVGPAVAEVPMIIAGIDPRDKMRRAVGFSQNQRDVLSQ
jgi:hypothetical protein